MMLSELNLKSVTYREILLVEVRWFPLSHEAFFVFRKTQIRISQNDLLTERAELA